MTFKNRFHLHHMSLFLSVETEREFDLVTLEDS